MTNNKKIILASGSPRRIEIMTSHGIEPIVMPASVEENFPPKSGMCETPMFLALKKAQFVETCYLKSAAEQESVAELNGLEPKPEFGFNDSRKALQKEISQKTLRSECSPIIIAADTIVYKDGEIMGKPTDKADGVRMLEKLRNTFHYVVTGVALLEAGARNSRVFAEITKVYFKDYSLREITSYLATDEAYDKAGAYAIQGYFAKHIDHIEGSFENVMGFPWDRIKKEIELL